MKNLTGTSDMKEALRKAIYAQVEGKENRPLTNRTLASTYYGIDIFVIF